MGGHDPILRTILKYLSITGTPKGGHGTMPPPKYATGLNYTALQFFFHLIAQFYTLNLFCSIAIVILLNVGLLLPNCLLFFCLKSQKMRYLHFGVKFQLRKLGCASTWYENAVL